MNRLTTFETGLNKALRPRTVLILSALAVFSTAVAFLFLNFRSGGFYLGQLFFESPDGTTDTFMDFYNSVYDAAMQPYDHQGYIPAAVLRVFPLLSGIIPGQYFEGAWVPRGGFTFYEIQNAKLMFVVFCDSFAVVVYCIFRYTSTFKGILRSFLFLWFSWRARRFCMLSNAGILLSMPLLSRCFSSSGMTTSAPGFAR